MKLHYTYQFKKLTAALALALLLMAAFFSPLASAQLFPGSKGDACSAVGAANSKGNCDQKALNASSKSLSQTLSNVINVLSILVGIAAVIMLIISGLRYVVSGGDSGGITSAKHTFIYALVGLIIVALAQAIVKYVLNRI
ncbi:pilin [Candidatus Parcubacteria bacterium]|nr:pilin [Candidatus Parcubacteria bacterium]